MPFRDNYTYFYYNDINSESMKVWVTNNRTLDFIGSPKFIDSFVTPKASQTRYYTNTSFTGTDIKINCIAINVTMFEWRQIQNWLSPDKQGMLGFEYMNGSYFNVKIAKPIQGKSFVTMSGEEDRYNIEFTIEFTTIHDWAAMFQPITVSTQAIQDEENIHFKLTEHLSDTSFKDHEVVLNITYHDLYHSYNTFMNAGHEPDATISDLQIDWLNTVLDAEADDIVLQGLNGTSPEPVLNMLKYNYFHNDVNLLEDSIGNPYGIPMYMNISHNGHNNRVPSGIDYVEYSLDTDTSNKKYHRLYGTFAGDTDTKPVDEISITTALTTNSVDNISTILQNFNTYFSAELNTEKTAYNLVYNASSEAPIAICQMELETIAKTPILRYTAFTQNDQRSKTLYQEHRKYLTEPTKISNQRIYFDRDYYLQNINSFDINNDKYYILDTAVEVNGDNIAQATLSFPTIATYQIGLYQDTETGVVSTTFRQHTESSNFYNLENDMPIVESGILYAGMSVIFTGSSQALSKSPFYIIEQGNTGLIMNPGSLDMFPELTVDMKDNQSVDVLINDQKQFYYDLTIKDALLTFCGDSGHVLCNGVLAETAVITNTNRVIKIVNKGLNNGPVIIPSGCPEKYKIQILRTVDSTADNTNYSHIIFQPIGDFKYARNDNFMCVFYTSISKEQQYNTNTYSDLYNNPGMPYGKNLGYYCYSYQGVLQSIAIGDTTYWILSIPHSDLYYAEDVLKQAFRIPSDLTSNNIYTPNTTLALCNSCQFSFATDEENDGTLTLQMRNVY